MSHFRRFWVNPFGAPNPSLYLIQVILSPKRVSSCKGVKEPRHPETLSDGKCCRYRTGARVTPHSKKKLKSNFLSDERSRFPPLEASSYPLKPKDGRISLVVSCLPGRFTCTHHRCSCGFPGCKEHGADATLRPPQSIPRPRRTEKK